MWVGRSSIFGGWCSESFGLSAACGVGCTLLECFASSPFCPARSQVLTFTGGGYYALSDTKMRFVLVLNTSYSALVASDDLGAFTADLRDAVAIAFKVRAPILPSLIPAPRWLSYCPSVPPSRQISTFPRWPHPLTLHHLPPTCVSSESMLLRGPMQPLLPVGRPAPPGRRTLSLSP